MRAERADIERDFLLGLAAEWEEAVSRLPRALPARLRRPRFALSDAVARPGVWDAACGEIRVSPFVGSSATGTKRASCRLKDRKSGEVQYNHAATHAAENVETGQQHVIVIELKK